MMLNDWITHIQFLADSEMHTIFGQIPQSSIFCHYMEIVYYSESFNMVSQTFRLQIKTKTSAFIHENMFMFAVVGNITTALI